MRFVLFLLLCAAAPAWADNRVQDPGAPWPTTVDTPRATAMGGAHAAIASGNDALSVNPAGLALGRKYHLEVDGLYDSRYPAQAILVSIVDSVSSAVANGMQWSRWASGQPSGSTHVVYTSPSSVMRSRVNRASGSGRPSIPTTSPSGAAMIRCSVYVPGAGGSKSSAGSGAASWATAAAAAASQTSSAAAASLTRT